MDQTKTNKKPIRDSPNNVNVSRNLTMCTLTHEA